MQPHPCTPPVYVQVHMSMEEIIKGDKTWHIQMVSKVKNSPTSEVVKNFICEVKHFFTYCLQSWLLFFSDHYLLTTHVPYTYNNVEIIYLISCSSVLFVLYRYLIAQYYTVASLSSVYQRQPVA